jgi:tetratricopeptide (TPR) repeat protein
MGAAASARALPLQNSPSAIGTLMLDPTDDLSRLEQVEAAIAAQKYEEAAPKLEAYLKDHPESWRAHYDLGYVEFRTHHIGASVKELSRSLALNLNNAEAHKILALDCNLVGRYDLAETELEEARRLKPGSAEIHYLLGRLYYTKGVYPLAKAEFESAIRLDSSYMKAYNNLGLTLEILGDNAAALKNYTTAAQLDEQQGLRSEWPYVYLSAYFNRQEQPKPALDYARKALELNPKSDLAYFQMAKAYRFQGDWKLAAEAARAAIQINPRTPDFYYVLSLALRKLGRTQESQQAMETFQRLQQQPVRTLQKASGRLASDPAMVPRDEP